MKTFVKIISWIMMIVAIIAFIGLLASPDDTSKAPGLFLGAAIFIQSISTVIYFEGEENGRN